MLSSLFFSSYTFSDPKKAPRISEKGKGKSSDRKELVSIAGPSFKNKNLIEALKDPKVVDGIKNKLFRATVITRKTILEGELVVVDDGSRSGSGSGAAIGDNDAPLTVFETTSHYDYDHISCTDFTPFSECSACKCQDCKAKHDGVINAINALTAFVKEMTSKRSVILSKRISYPYTPPEIKAAKKRRKDTSKASSSIEKSNITMLLSSSCADVQCTRATGEQHEPNKVDVIVEATTEEHNITVYNPSTASKKEEKVEPPEVFRNEEYLINIIKGFSISTGLPWHLVDEVYIPINYGDEFHWVLAIVVLKERRIQVYHSMSRRRRFEFSSEIQKLAKILSTYLDMSGFLDQKVRTDWSTIEAYRDKMGNLFDVQYVKGISQQTIGSLLAILKNKNTWKESDAEGSLNQFIDYPSTATHAMDAYYVVMEYQVVATDYTSAV
ncbi:hypothetical protein T459_12156 [Capsicum annuum]|uniref:Ubiquitin-like protease family profile domain-containing protein n=1 Tax=Capsicum annuum TaxID=4072 RepID=A0A2G2ZP20_CAPAN|nr:hypothetical protein T459_12156 [Capsicum annuum]